MKTIRFIANPVLSEKDLNAATAFLANGHIMAIPTETVYGLAADIFQPEAIRQIFRVKERPIDNPLIAHISTMDQLDRIAQNPHLVLLKLAEHFWPGPITLIFDRRNEVPPIASAHLPTIAVRMPSHSCARQIIDRLGSPLVAPSANLSGKPSPTTAFDVLEDLDGKIPAVVDGGPCAFGIESTVLGWMDEKLILLRPGAIDRKEIEAVSNMRVFDPMPQGSFVSPGMKYRHYAPKAKLSLVENENEIKKFSIKPGVYIPKNLTDQNLYFHLRNADRLGYVEMVIYVDEKLRSNEALMNRLKKAVG